MSTLPIFLLISAVAPELGVGVVPISGSSDPGARQEATQILMSALSGVPGIRVISFANLEAVLGPAARRDLDACSDDRCVVAVTAAIRTDQILLGSLDDEGKRMVLRLRLVESSSAARSIARVTRDVAIDRDSLRAGVSESVLELFPDRARESVGVLEIRGAMPGARIVVDGRMSATIPLDAVDPEAPAILRLSPGVHQIEVSAPGHFPANERAEVLAGQRTQLEIDLRRNRSYGPMILGGVGAVSAIAGAILGGVVRGKANAWNDACPVRMPCSAGFSRERYESDRQTIDQGRTVANVLYGVAGAAAIGAVIWFFVDPGSDPQVHP